MICPTKLVHAEGDFSGILNLMQEDAIRGKRFSEEHITFALRQVDSGTTIEEICRKWGSRSQHFIAEGLCGRLKQIEDENAKLKRAVADLTLDKASCRMSCDQERHSLLDDGAGLGNQRDYLAWHGARSPPSTSLPSPPT